MISSSFFTPIRSLVPRDLICYDKQDREILSFDEINHNES